MLFLPFVIVHAQALNLEWLTALGGWGNLTASGLLVIVVMMILVGLLLPRFVYLQKAEEVKYLRAANEKLRNIADEAVKTSAKVVEALEALQKTLKGMHPPGEAGDNDDEVV